MLQVNAPSFASLLGNHKTKVQREEAWGNGRSPGPFMPENL